MIEIQLKNHKYTLPTKWEELNPAQFIYLCALLVQFNAGSIDLIMLRALFACHLLGLRDRDVLKLSSNDRFNENIYRIGAELRFFVRYEYENKASFNRIPKTTRDALLRIDPDELGDSTHVRWARKAQKHLVLDFNFNSQLMPVIKRRRMLINGYQFAVTDGILESSLTAGQFADAMALYSQILKLKEGDASPLLTKLVAKLYSATESQVAGLPMATMQAVLFNFMAVQTFLFERTHYRVLFNTNKSEALATKQSSGNNQGFAGAIYAMTEKGYGSMREMKDTNLVDFLEAMYADLRRTLKKMKDSDMDLTDIAKATGLTVKTINTLL